MAGGTLSVRGTADGPAFVLETALTGTGLPAFPPVLPFQVRETRLRLSNRLLGRAPGIAGPEADVWGSELEVLWEGTMGTQTAVPAIIRFYPFRQGKLTEFYVSFGDGGTLVDAGAFMSGCLGFPADFSAMLPAGFPFVSQVKPRDFRLNVGEDGGSYSIQGFSLKLCYEDEGALFTLAGLSFRSLYLELSYHGQSGSGTSFAPAAGGTLEVGGIPLEFRFGSPYLSLTVDSRNRSGMTPVSIQDLAKNLGFSVPDFFASVLIRDVFLQAQLEGGSFFSYFYFAEASEAKLGGSVSDGLSLAWKESAVSLRVGNGRTQAGLRSVLLLKGAGETLGAFSLAGTWMPGELAFSGRWTAGKGSFNRIYEAVFSHRLPAQVPVFTVCLLELSGRMGKTVALERIRGLVKAEITDESLLGFGFSLTADLLSDESGFSCTGLMEFAHYFTLEVMAAWKKDGGFSWAFTLLLENWRLAVSYDKGKGAITGRLESPCTLGDLADALLRLLNPSDSFKRSGAWSFLNSLSFTGCGITYWEKTGRMEFSLDMGYKNAFVQISRLTAALDGNGVQFQIVGNFLGTDYTQENPLAFSPNDPPDTQGRGFSVDYLGLAKGVEPPRLTPGAPVAQNLEALKQAWNQETSLESLTLQENAGILFGLEMNLASMLKIQLLYQEAQGYCGGRFALDGPKAGALAGLSAELSYGKLQNGLGVFAGKFVPSKQMKTLSFGAVRLGLGEVEGLLYTNGDFYLDAGFPKNLDFSRSFAVSYGAFHGKGGLYVRKARQFASQTSPYSWCFQMGLGLRISLGTDYRSSMFSAGASVIMAGCFEGLYGSRSEAESVDKGHYELSATAQFQGLLHGSVDFGIIGASVSVELFAQTDLTLKSDEAAQVTLSFHVQASAKVKVAFIRISFGFSLNGYLHFSLGSSGQRLAERGERRRRPLLPPAADGPKGEYTLRLGPVFSMCSGQPCVNLFLLMDNADFEDMLRRLSKLLQSADEAEPACSLELFDRLLYLRTKGELYRILETGFVFRVEAFDDPSVFVRDPVLVPLPEFLRQEVVTEYKSGQTDLSRRELATYAYANDSYVEKMKQYYEETQRRSDSAAEEEVSMTARIFMDFFELIFRSIKAQKCHSGLCSEPFDELRLSGSQLGNIQGMVNRFLLGGRRGIYEPAGVMRGMFSMSGQQVVLNDSDRVSGYRFRVEPLTPLPEWLVCSGEKPPELAFSREEARQYFPACAYTAGIFTEGPKVAAFYTEEEMPVTLTTLMSVEQTVYCKGVPGTRKDGSCPAYGGMFWIQAAPVRRGSRVCAISEYGDTRCLPQWAEEGRAEALKLLYADREGAYHFLEAEKLFCLGSDKTGEKHMAYVGQPQLFLEMVEHTLETGEELFLSFPEEAAFLPDGDEPFKLFFAVHLKPLTAYEEFCTCIIAQKGEALELRTGDRLWRRQSGFGNLLVKCSTFMHEEDDEQSRLYAVYNNLGAELIYDGKLSHETPPYVEQEEDGRREFELFLPYGRACGMGEAPYEMVTAGKPLTIRLFWIDLLGNRMEAGRELSWTPVYTDRLTGLWEYEGISLGASYAGQGAGLYLELTLHYDPNQPEEALPASKSLSWTQGLRQLSQPDVRLELRTSLQADPCTLDKEAVLTFLRACEKVPDQPGSLTLRMKLDGWKREPGLAALWQELTVKRDKALCLEDGPSEVWTISREVALAQNADALPGAMHLYTEQERWYVLTTSADALIENVRWTGAFGFLPFPAVSGIFQDGGREYRLNGVGLNAILDDFLSDFQMLNQPETLCRMGAQSDTAPLLPTLYGLRRSVARALASRVVSFDKDAPETLLKKVRSVAEQFFYAHPDLDRKQLIFLAGSVEWSDVFPMTYRGVIGSGDGFPMGISLEEKQFSFLGAVQTGEKLPAGELPLVMRHLRPRNGAVSYTPWEMRPGTEAVCVDLPQDLCPPSSLPPDTPVLLSFTAGEAAELTFSVNPAADTEVHLRFMEKERGALRAADNSPLAAMETYRRESIALLQDLSPENLKRLTALMEDFCHSVEQFEQNTTAETGTHMWSWEKDENGNIEKLTANRQVMEDGIRFYYQTETSPGLEMEKTEDGYRFQKDYLPREGSTLILRLRFHSSRALQDGQLWTLRKSSYENPVFLLSSPKAAF